MSIEEMKAILMEEGVSEEDFEAVREEFTEEDLEAVREEFTGEELEQIEARIICGASVDSAIQSLFM